MRKQTIWIPTRSDTNRAIQTRKMVTGLKFQIYVEEGLYYPCSESKGADQLRGYREADLRLLFSPKHFVGFPKQWLISTLVNTRVSLSFLPDDHIATNKSSSISVLGPLNATLILKKVKVGYDQEMAKSERNPHSKNRSGKKLNKQTGTYTKKTYSKPNGQVFSQ